MRGTWKMALSTPVPSASSSSRPPNASPTRFGAESTTDPETSLSLCPGPDGGKRENGCEDVSDLHNTVCVGDFHCRCVHV